MRGRRVILQIIQCQHCDRQELAFADPRGFGTRIGGHKCAGAWTTVKSIEVTLAEVKKNSFTANAWKNSEDTITRRIREA